MYVYMNILKTEDTKAPCRVTDFTVTNYNVLHDAFGINKVDCPPVKLGQNHVFSLFFSAQN